MHQNFFMVRKLRKLFTISNILSKHISCLFLQTYSLSWKNTRNMQIFYRHFYG